MEDTEVKQFTTENDLQHEDVIMIYTADEADEGSVMGVEEDLEEEDGGVAHGTSELRYKPSWASKEMPPHR